MILKKIVTQLRACLLGVILVLIVLGKTSHSAQAAPTKKYTAIGDNLTAGVSTNSDPSLYSDCFAAQIHDYIVASRGYAPTGYRNRAIIGATSTNTFSSDRTKGVWENQIAASIADAPDLVTLSVGINDLKNYVLSAGTPDNPTDLNDTKVVTFSGIFGTGIRRVLTSLRTELPGTSIILTNVPKLWLLPAVSEWQNQGRYLFPGATPQERQTQAQLRLSSYIIQTNNVIATEAAATNSIVIDLYNNDVATAPNHVSIVDGFNLNLAGHDALAGLFITALDDLLSIDSSLVVTTTDDGKTNTDRYLSLREAIALGNRDQTSNSITFAVTGTIRLTRELPTINTSSTSGFLSIEGSANRITISGDADNSGGVGASGDVRPFVMAIGANVLLDRLDIRSSWTSGNGGSLYNVGTLVVKNCVFSDNAAGYGAAIYNDGLLTVESTSFVNNSGNVAGAVYNVDRLEVRNSTFANNTANTGGALYSQGSSFDNGSTAAPQRYSILSNCTFFGNNANVKGGAFYVTRGLTKIENCTIAGNRAPSNQGSGISSLGIQGVTIRVANSIIADNRLLNNDAGTDIDYSSDSVNPFESQGNNLIGSGRAISDFNHSGDRTFILAAQLNLADLADNGGLVQTVALLPGSVAFNAGNNALVPNDVATDGRGTNYARILDGTVDVGAYEFEGKPQNGPDFVVNQIDDSNDGICTEFDCTLREAVNAANIRANVPPGTPDTISFGSPVFGSQKTIVLSTGLSELSDDTTIVGPSARLTIDGVSKTVNIFSVGAGAIVNFRELTIGNGYYGIANQGTTIVSACVLESGITSFYDKATLIIDNCISSGGVSNSGTGTITNSSFKESGIGNSGTITIENCTVSATLPDDGVGISNAGIATITNCTVIGKHTGIFTYLSAPNTSSVATITNCTISGNLTGVYNTTTAIFKNSLIVGNNANVRGTHAVTLGASNRYGGTAASAGLEVDGNGKPVLKDNGGPTPTIALVNMSGPAVNAGDDSLVPEGITTDQRGIGFGRIKGSAVDIGAFEVQDATPPKATIDSPLLANAVLTTLPSQISGTYDDDLGPSNITKLSCRLYRSNGGGREYWNSVKQTWQSAAVRLPVGLRPEGIWRSTSNLPRNSTGDGTNNLHDGAYGLTTILVNKSGKIGSVAIQFRIQAAQDFTLPVVHISNIQTNAAYTTLPSSFNGTVNDNNGVFNIRSVTLRLRRIRSTPTGLIKEHWNSRTLKWQTAISSLPTSPVRPSLDNIWASTATLPSGSDLVEGTYCLTAIARDWSDNQGITWTFFRIVPSTASIIDASTIKLSAMSAKSDGIVTLVFTGPLDTSADEAHHYEVVANKVQIEVQDILLTNSNTTVVLKLGQAIKDTSLRITYTLKDSRGSTLFGVANAVAK